ncbi:MAG: hypothetical protein K9N47_10130 [Prosthecobacter sp.]|uniref:hypothetical protein n=1 Tax=Prosthecobacter sp. TaxID=1965333 RepID=UPI0025F47A73|nr:hypothetical protein [Prosthecobacter sp.]MCF7786471.1 hypothetical protein [Prosthecobacter sp.]
MLTHASVAADANWTGATGTQLWSTGTNWSTSSAPGALTGTTNADIATFNTALGATTITIDAGRNLRIAWSSPLAQEVLSRSAAPAPMREKPCC